MHRPDDINHFMGILTIEGYMKASLRYKLVVKRGPHPGVVYTLPGSTVVMGRGHLCDITFNEPTISREHVKLVSVAGGGYMALDLGSTNGSYLNGRRLHGAPLMLNSGDEIQLADRIVLIFIDEALPPVRNTDTPFS